MCVSIDTQHCNQSCRLDPTPTRWSALKSERERDGDGCEFFRMNNFQQFAPFKLTQQVLLKLLGGLPNARKLGVQLNQAQVNLNEDYLATHLFALRSA